MSLLLSKLQKHQYGLLVRDFGCYWGCTVHFITTAWLVSVLVVFSESNLPYSTGICDSQQMLLNKLHVTSEFTLLVFLLFILPSNMVSGILYSD